MHPQAKWVLCLQRDTLLRCEKWCKKLMESVRLLREAKGDAKIHTQLRHSFINYRMAKIKNANEVALEAGFDSARAKCASARIEISK